MYGKQKKKERWNRTKEEEIEDMVKKEKGEEKPG